MTDMARRRSPWAKAKSIALALFVALLEEVAAVGYKFVRGLIKRTILAFMSALVLGWVWNVVMVPKFDLPTLTYIQWVALAVAIYTLS